MKTLELKIPPPAVALLFALFMWFAAPLTQIINLSPSIRIGLAITLVVIGQSISIAGMIRFRRAKTTINPVKASAASALVTGGVYQFTRNPMYVGLSLTLFAWAVFLSSPITLLFVPLFVLYINRFQIIPEERVLTSLFGNEYVAYKSKMKRWV